MHLSKSPKLFSSNRVPTLGVHNYVFGKHLLLFANASSKISQCFRKNDPNPFVSFPMAPVYSWYSVGLLNFL